MCVDTPPPEGQPTEPTDLVRLSHYCKEHDYNYGRAYYLVHTGKLTRYKHPDRNSYQLHVSLAAVQAYTDYLAEKPEPESAPSPEPEPAPEPERLIACAPTKAAALVAALEAEPAPEPEPTPEPEPAPEPVGYRGAVVNGYDHEGGLWYSKVAVSELHHGVLVREAAAMEEVTGVSSTVDGIVWQSTVAAPEPESVITITDKIRALEEQLRTLQLARWMRSEGRAAVSGSICKLLPNEQHADLVSEEVERMIERISERLEAAVDKAVGHE